VFKLSIEPTNGFTILNKTQNYPKKKEISLNLFKYTRSRFPNAQYSFELFFTFFGDTSEDEEKNLFKFKSICHDFKFTEENVTCILFLQTLRGDALEWYSSLLPNSITSWDGLENPFAENFIPRVHSYVSFMLSMLLLTHPISYGHKIMK
jgi:hypothetical protein